MALSGGLLDGRVVIVTGGGGGIGRSHCLELASHGAVVVVNDLGVALDGDATASDPASQVVATIEESGGTASANGRSVADFDAMRGLVSETVERYGRLDAIVNNAGILRDGVITSSSAEDFDAVLSVHLKGTFNLTKHACDYWRAEYKSGQPTAARIVNTTSGAGLMGSVGQIAYGAAKAAIANMTMTTALEGARYGVTANCISPLAATRMTATVGWEAESAGWDRLDPANSSPVVAWLCSEASGWLTGRILRVDGADLYPVQPWTIGPGLRSRTGERLDANEIDAGLRIAFGTAPAGVAGLRVPAVVR
ncbi:MAG: SDR family NAD(P)-dependent oxidoreductase [Aeromicrobium sp.]